MRRYKCWNQRLLCTRDIAIIAIIVNVIIKAYCQCLYMYSLNCANNNVIIHIAVLICNLSVAVTPYNYEQTDSYNLFLAEISNI